MLNGLWNDKLDESANVLAMLKGHQYFLDRNTGVTDDAKLQHYVFNPQMILSNNRHFIAASMQEAQPNGDATTEGQALQIIGYCYAYMGTRDSKFLTKAIECFNAYITYFYGGQPIPNPPAPYICNWLVNGKEPVLANYPINWESPTHSGFKGEMLTYTNGLASIPHGAPYFGQYLDKATFAFVGALGWDSIVATVYGVNPDGSTNWDTDGIQYDVEWIINWEGKKISGDAWSGIDIDGDQRSGSGWVISDGHAEEEKGKIQLGDKSLNGDFKSNFSPKVPVAEGGYMMGRNEAWHNRPLNVPVNVSQYGNAADAEEWFADAAYLLWRLTNEERYWLAWKSAIATTDKYSDVDQFDKFFRRSTSDITPFTDGISYDYTYPSDSVVTYGRDASGYITMGTTKATQNTMEQQAVWFSIDKNSRMYTEFGGICTDGKPVECKVTLQISDVKNSNDPSNRRYVFNLPPSTSATPKPYSIPLSSFTPEVDINGYDYFLASANKVYSWGTGTEAMVYEGNVYDGRSTLVAKGGFPDLDAGYGIGFWSQPNGLLEVRSICYKADAAMELNIIDADNWRWYWTLNATGSYVNRKLDKSNLVLRSYQPSHPDTDPRPSFPNFDKLDEITITPTVANTSFSWYCVNDIPPTFNKMEGYTMMCSVKLSGDSAMTALLGDATITGYKKDNLFCTPGVIPFSNISVPDTVQFDGWRGMPYPGYQYPFIYSIEETAGEYTTRLNNMVEFMWQSQQAYFNNYGQLGPGMSAYIWNRWDNLKYGTPDTWTMYHWGDGHAWAGYQPRAFAGAARAWYELVIQGKPVPPKLKEYVENWIKWLYPAFKEHGCSPTDWKVDGTPVFDLTDYTGHMSGLWLAGACFAVLAGSTLSITPDYIEMVRGEIEDHYHNTGIPNQIMNGSWSPALRLNTGNGPESNAMFFGFWSGETMRGLGMYLLYKQLAPKQDMYKQFN